MDDKKREEILEQLGKNSDKKLLKELEEIRKNGYAIYNNVSSEYIYSIAVPVFNFEDKTIGVISATSLKNKDIDIENQIMNLINVAKSISKVLGYRKN